MTGLLCGAGRGGRGHCRPAPYRLGIWFQISCLGWPRSPEGELFVRRTGDLTVVGIPLCCQGGDMKARVAFDADERVASVFFLNPDTP
jgi:hypothetical protein